MVLALIMCCLFAAGSAAIAKKKDRSPVGFGIVGFVGGIFGLGVTALVDRGNYDNDYNSNKRIYRQIGIWALVIIWALLMVTITLS